jgi:PEGA domain
MGLVLLAAPSAALGGEPRTAIAAISAPPSLAPELNRAFQESLPEALGAAGFALKPPAEVDMQMGERPEFVNCKGGGCLAEEAAFLRVARLILPRLEPSAGGLVVGLSVYDGSDKKVIAESIDRCAPCSTATLRTMLFAAAQKLHADLARPGTLEVASQPPAALLLDGKPVGETPWSGSVDAGDHVIAIDSPGGRVERDVTVAPGRVTRLELALPPIVGGPKPPARPLRIFKWVAGGVGIAGVAAGAALIAVDGNGTCSLRPGQRQCAKVLDTLPLGAGLAAVGGALLVTSVVLFVIDRPARKFALGATPTVGGFALTAAGRF